MTNPKNIRVLGAGVTGLTTAVVLQEAGYDVEVWASQFSPHTTSDCAGAVWYPQKLEPFDEVKLWCRETYRELMKLAALPQTGIRIGPVHQHFFRPMGTPWWASDVRNFLRHSFSGQGIRTRYSFEGPLIDPPLYLRYLRKRANRAGVQFHTCHIHSKVQATQNCALTINCCGFGSLEWNADSQLFPIRGQTVLLPGANQTWLSSDCPQGSLSVVPREDGLALSGNAWKYNKNQKASEAESAGIVRRAKQYLSNFSSLSPFNVCVGLRPGRARIRIEKEILSPQTQLIHHYGHSGSGFTLSWGTARKVLSLIEHPTLC